MSDPVLSSRHASEARCDHCGDALAGLKIVHRQLAGRKEAYCCLGCAFIAEQLHLAAAVGAAVTPGPTASAAARVAAAAAGDPAQPATEALTLRIDGMVCGACALLLARRLQRTRGVQSAQVDFASRRAALVIDSRIVAEAQIARTVRRAGYRVVDPRLPQAPDRRARRVALLRLLGAWLVMMQVMMLAAPTYFAAPGEIAADIEQLLRIAQLILTVPALLYCAAPLARAAASQLRTGAVAMDLPIVIGLLVAFAASVHATRVAAGPVYFDSITMFIALVLAVRAWQARALVAAAAHLDRVTDQAALQALRLAAWPGSLATDPVGAERLRVGDVLLVPAGAMVPADGRVLSGASSVSQAWLTGEAAPVLRGPGAAVLAGSLNFDQPLIVQVTRVGAATALAALQRLMIGAAFTRPRLALLADRVAHGFLWAVLAVAAATGAGWWLIDAAQALPNAVAVLVATCPCALALAAPAVLASAQGALARRGVLVARAAALEVLARVDVVATDKTGTLTEATPVLQQIVALRAVDAAALLAIAASLESVSAHPFARALSQHARAQGLPSVAPAESRLEPAAGVEGVVDGVRHRIGTRDFALGLAQSHGAAPEHALRRAAWQARLDPALAALEASDQPGSISVLVDEAGPLALFVFGEQLRTGAARLVESLRRRGCEVLLLSGDRRRAVAQVALAAGFDVAAALAHQTPEDKRRRVDLLQRAGRTVAMIGDGVNDAPVLAQADASIALAEGADLAQARADVIVLGAGLDAVQDLFEIARRARRLMHQNLAWALLYNVIVVPLAALGHLAPALAVAGMAASSTLVVANALRAGRSLPRRACAPPGRGRSAPAPAAPWVIGSEPMSASNAQGAAARATDLAEPWNRSTC